MTRTERQNMCVENWIKHGCVAIVVAPTGFGAYGINL